MISPVSRALQQYRISIPGWRPVLLNKLMRMHYTKANRLKKQDAETIAIACKSAGVPEVNLPRSVRDDLRKAGVRAGGLLLPERIKRSVSLEIILSGRQKESDGDSMWKSFLDGLVSAGALVDDSQEWCEILLPVKFSRGSESGTVIVLTDLR